MPRTKRPAIHYIHRLDYSLQERLVGLFILVALGIVFALFFVNSSTAHLFDKRIHFNAYLSNAAGISTKTPVKVSGIEVGHVSAIDITANNRIQLTLAVYERYHPLVREDSRASVGKLSMLGNATIEIIAGSPERAFLSDGALLDVEEPMSLDELMAELTPVLLGVKLIITNLSAVSEAIRPERLDAAVNDIAGAAATLNRLGEQIASGHGVAGSLLYDAELEAQLRRTLDRMESALGQAEERFIELEPTFVNLQTTSAQGGELLKEVRPLVGDSRELIVALHESVTAVNLELHRLPELVSRMQQLLLRADSLLEGVQGVWPLNPEPQPSPRDALPLPRGE